MKLTPSKKSLPIKQEQDLLRKFCIFDLINNTVCIWRKLKKSNGQEQHTQWPYPFNYTTVTQEK